jgi:hypothetical protein
MPNKTQFQNDIQALLALSDSELELELGRRLTQTEEEVRRNESLTAANPTGLTVDQASLQALPDFVRKTAERFLQKFNRQLYSLVCDATDPDNEKLRTAAGQGVEALGYALGGALVVAFGWLPGIATVIGVYIAKRLAKSGYEAVCETWKEQL